jgi:hypothetical protein
VNMGQEVKHDNFIPDYLASILLAVSGFICARAVTANVEDFRIYTLKSHLIALTIAGALFVIFAVTRTRKAGFANAILFVATWVCGLVRW